MSTANGQTVGILEFDNALNLISGPMIPSESGADQSLNRQHRAPISKASSIELDGCRFLHGS